MVDDRHAWPGSVLRFAAIVEAITGLALFVAPALVVQLLLGHSADDISAALGRCFGISLLALATACWPMRNAARVSRRALAGMLLYNGLVAAFLVYLRLAENLGGVLLWPGVVLHAGVATLLGIAAMGVHRVPDVEP